MSAIASGASTGVGGASDVKKAVAAKEREVDYKITHYATFADNIEQVVFTEKTLSPVDIDEFNSSDHMRAEIQKLLDELRELNRQLLAAGSGVSSNVTQQHMGRLQTYTQDFQRVHTRITEAWNSAQLRRGASSRSRTQNPAWGSDMQQLMDEQNANRGAHRAADRVIAQASAAHADLEAQRQREVSIASRLSNIGRSVPGLNSLMTRIRGRRERDRLIMAGCIGTCITLIILYSLR